MSEIFQQLQLTKVDTSHPAVYFYGSPRDEFYNSNDVTEGSVNQFFDTPIYIDTQNRLRNSSSLQLESRQPKSFDPIPPEVATIGISVKPRQDDVTERTFVEPDHYDVINGIVVQPRHDDVINGIDVEPSYYDVTEMIVVEPRLDEVTNGVVVSQHEDVIDGDVVPRLDRMDDFQPNGGLVNVNETLLRAVGLIQTQVWAYGCCCCS